MCYKFKLLIFLIFFIFSASNLYGQPNINSVNGEVVHKKSVTILGNYFGTKSTAHPLKFEDWEDGTIGSLLNTTGYWKIDSNNETNQKPQFSAGKLRHSNSTKNAKFYLSGMQDMIWRELIPFGNKIFLDVWFYFQWANPNYKHQIKSIKMQSGPGPSSKSGAYRPTFNIYHWVTSDEGDKWCYAIVFNGGEGSYAARSTISAPKHQSWVHYQLQLNNSSPGDPNGSYKLWQNGSLVADEIDKALRAESDPQWSAVHLGKYIGNYNGMPENNKNTTLYYGEVYFDSSWSRVEIGDKSIYENCTHRETQIPSSWSNRSITISVNQGSFNSGVDAYLYVVDSNGDVNNQGYPVTIGGGSSNNPPNPPTGLHVVGAQ